MRQTSGFSLTELLVALTILGILAAFGIPSILNSQGDKADRARYKETLAAVQGAFAGYKASGKANANTRFSDFTSYLKYSEVITNQPSYIDAVWGSTGTNGCNDWSPCLKMHNGAVIHYDYGDGTIANSHTFGGTSNQNFLFFKVDPDGKVTSQNNAAGSGKTLDSMVYYNGNVGLLPLCRTNDSTYYFGTNVSGTMWCNTTSHNVNNIPPYAR